MVRIRWQKILPRMCCRCNKEATHTFSKKTLLVDEEKDYCDKHILDRIREEKLQ